MNGIGIETLAVLAVVLAAYGLRDGILFAWLIHRLLGNTDAAPVVPVAPAPAPGQPAPLPGAVPVPLPDSKPPAAAIAKPRFTGITATSFAGGNDSAFSRTSAYDGKIINGDTELAAAAPYHFPGKPPVIRVFYPVTGRSVDVPTRDVGPWNTKDDYWNKGTRPQAETGTDTTGRHTNLAGLDLSPAAWKALGYTGDARNAKDKVDWDFADVLDGKAPSAAPSSPTISVVPPWLVLMRKLRDMGVHAEHDSAIIMAWPPAIGNKYPEMADYCKGYLHDTTPWCGLTVAYVLAASGIRPQFGATDTDRFLWAASWLQFGTAVETPQPGDVMVFQWAGGGHHVTLYDHEVDDNSYHCTGGNQGNSHVVSTEAMPMANCIGIRRPPTPTN